MQKLNYSMGKAPFLDYPIHVPDLNELLIVLSFAMVLFSIPLGVEKLVRHLHKHKIPIAVATGSSASEYNIKTSNYKDLFHLFLHAVKSDDPELKHSKPAPDIFQLAAARFPVPPTSPRHVLVLEDAPNGVTAARAAGMNVVMVPDKRVDKLKCSQAHLVLDSLEEFDPAVWGFPPF